ncbi:AGL181Cp [Eremothecium gossypii ATCC 10895]|uniref:AGL181Cp n=1 Tax=Eremothecium gossypii (strain ATCC 10895 / CBS 109.51 / FGSC 9923 / NRRL Y-1056) TaxID=284811 RepID=Q750X0_EREGS|nr:AGL181Cp [Eremothecium gossypii ATCC 10895]AAS54310.1 AGL181Cp [Eremothecium gossypii ATCC 10895]AEY98636.1 FAGL181Cp [Eremothecium gossypii FDAG1]
MADFESVLGGCVDFLQERVFRELPENAVTVCMEREAVGGAEVVAGEWGPLEGVTDKQIRRDMQMNAFRAVVVRVVQGGREDGGYLANLAAVLDCVHWMQAGEGAAGDAAAWANLYFDLTKSAMQFLAVPDGFLAFWPYFESRLAWYLQGQDVVPVRSGENRLVSGIRLPLSRLLYHCNELVRQLEAQSKLNTPRHYMVAHKLQWFMSQLLPASENCNYNKSGELMAQLPETLWAQRGGKLRDARSPSLFRDWTYFVEEFVLDPVGVMVSPLRERQGFEEYTNDIIEFLLEKEQDYYRKVASAVQGPNLIRQDLHRGLIPTQASTNNFREPQDSRHSICASKAAFWKHYSEVYATLEDVMHPLPLELCMEDEHTLNHQLETVEVDTFRKLVLLQITITCNIVDQILRDKAIYRTYVTRYKNVHSGRAIPNDPPTLFKFFSTAVGRIRDFYRVKDPQFFDMLNELLHADESFLFAKAANMAPFKEIAWNTESLGHAPEPACSFKKFGFITMGNKRINDVWKIESGLKRTKDLAKAREIDPTGVYSALQAVAATAGAATDADSRIVKQWQDLRALRFEYLFELAKVDETTGINGLFDPTLIAASREDKDKRISALHEAYIKRHREDLEKAEMYFRQQSEQSEDKGDELSRKRAASTPDSADDLPETKRSRLQSESVPAEHLESAETPDTAKKSEPQEKEQESDDDDDDEAVPEC